MSIMLVMFRLQTHCQRVKFAVIELPEFFLGFTFVFSEQIAVLCSWWSFRERVTCSSGAFYE